MMIITTKIIATNIGRFVHNRCFSKGFLRINLPVICFLQMTVFLYVFQIFTQNFILFFNQTEFPIFRDLWTFKKHITMKNHKH